MRILYIFLTVGIIVLMTFFVLKNSFQTKTTSRFETLSQKQNVEQSMKTDPVFDKTVDDLPGPIARWIRRSGVLSKTDTLYMDMKHTGQMRLDPESDKWLSARATQRVGLIQPGFAWQVEADVAPGLNVLGLDSFIDGSAGMQIKVLGVLPVANVRDTEEVNESTLHRYLLEMGWYPQMALHKDIRWTEIDANRAKATMAVMGVQASVVIEINEKGQFVASKAHRYYDGNKPLKRIPFEGHAGQHAVFDGVEIPSEMEAVWILDKGPFKWYKVKVESVDYHH